MLRVRAAFELIVTPPNDSLPRGRLVAYCEPLADSCQLEPGESAKVVEKVALGHWPTQRGHWLGPLRSISAIVDQVSLGPQAICGVAPLPWSVTSSSTLCASI